MKKQSFYNFTLDELENFCVANGAKKFNAKQIYDWVYKKHVKDFNLMSNLSKTTISILNEKLSLDVFDLEKILIDDRDGTTKFLFKLEDGHFIESVLMRFNWGNSVCISSEVGCPMGCKFCASGQLKIVRKLQPYEFVLQYHMINEYLFEKENQRVNNIVVMGIGEPFDNYDNLIQALKIINCPYGIEIGSRHITVSTCGLVDKIVQFAKDQPQINLAISLHAPTDEIRNQIMPVNKVYPLATLLKAVDTYLKITNRRISFEYLMIDKLNDTDECLAELIKIAKNRLCYINLISYNSTSKNSFTKSKRINYFKDALNNNNIMTTLRLERGSKIDAACGQLRAKYEK